MGHCQRVLPHFPNNDISSLILSMGFGGCRQQVVEGIKFISLNCANFSSIVVTSKEIEKYWALVC